MGGYGCGIGRVWLGRRVGVIVCVRACMRHGVCVVLVCSFMQTCILNFGGKHFGVCVRYVCVHMYDTLLSIRPVMLFVDSL